MLTMIAGLAALQDSLSGSLHHDPLTAVAILFGAGVLTSLTPCIYPMIPITASILSGSGAEQRGRGRTLALTLAYVSGLALLYATMGLLAGLTGTLFGTVASSVWARLGIAGLLTVFGLAMLEIVPIRVPRRWLQWAGSARATSLPAVFLLGAASGIVAAPCGAPAFAAVLTWVAATRSGWLGFVYLLVFSLGMTTLLVAVGLSSGTLARLPKAGRWMVWIKKGGGAVMLLMAAYYGYQAWLVF